jgi:hypothetical protein
MDSDESEACGRCAMSSVVDVANSTSESDGGPRDPYGDERIEVSESEMRKAAAPVVVAGRVKRKLNEIATRLTYGRP